MSRVVITIEDDHDGVSIGAQFDRPVDRTDEIHNVATVMMGIGKAYGEDREGTAGAVAKLLVSLFGMPGAKQADDGING